MADRMMALLVITREFTFGNRNVVKLVIYKENEGRTGRIWLMRKTTRN